MEHKTQKQPKPTIVSTLH